MVLIIGNAIFKRLILLCKERGLLIIGLARQSCLVKKHSLKFSTVKV